MFVRQLVPEEEPLLGVGPLQLAIALVVITIIIAAGLSFWASGFSNRGVEKETDCTIASFKLYSGEYDSSTSSVSFVLENLQPTELRHLTFYVFYPDKTIIEKPMEENLGASKLQPYNFEDVPKDFEKGMVKTNCPNVNVEFIEQNGTLIEI
ncbi:MAG: hypothetical protein ISS48_04720 [Candidatus Aenigmarchaeota archaeon]|nr:hypothetical protein [Candidatus Aenigmarchaeota archaeon]